MLFGGVEFVNGRRLWDIVPADAGAQLLAPRLLLVVILVRDALDDLEHAFSVLLSSFPYDAKLSLTDVADALIWSE